MKKRMSKRILPAAAAGVLFAATVSLNAYAAADGTGTGTGGGTGTGNNGGNGIGAQNVNTGEKGTEIKETVKDGNEETKQNGDKEQKEKLNVDANESGEATYEGEATITTPKKQSDGSDNPSTTHDPNEDTSGVQEDLDNETQSPQTDTETDKNNDNIPDTTETETDVSDESQESENENVPAAKVENESDSQEPSAKKTYTDDENKTYTEGETTNNDGSKTNVVFEDVTDSEGNVTGQKVTITVTDKDGNLVSQKTVEKENKGTGSCTDTITEEKKIDGTVTPDGTTGTEKAATEAETSSISNATLPNKTDGTGNKKTWFDLEAKDDANQKAGDTVTVGGVSYTVTANTTKQEADSSQNKNEIHTIELTRTISNEKSALTQSELGQLLGVTLAADSNYSDGNHFTYTEGGTTYHVVISTDGLTDNKNVATTGVLSTTIKLSFDVEKSHVNGAQTTSDPVTVTDTTNTLDFLKKSDGSDKPKYTTANDGSKVTDDTRPSGVDENKWASVKTALEAAVADGSKDFKYNSDGYLESFTDASGNTYKFTYKQTTAIDASTFSSLSNQKKAELLGTGYSYDDHGVYLGSDGNKKTLSDFDVSALLTKTEITVTKQAAATEGEQGDDQIKDDELEQAKKDAYADALYEAASAVVKDAFSNDSQTVTKKSNVDGSYTFTVKFGKKNGDHAEDSTAEYTFTQDSTDKNKWNVTIDGVTYTYNFNVKVESYEGEDVSEERKAEIQASLGSNQVLVSAYQSWSTVTVTGAGYTKSGDSASLSGVADAGDNKQDDDYSQEPKQSAMLFKQAYNVGDTVQIGDRTATVTEVVEVNGVSRIKSAQYYTSASQKKLETITYTYTMIPNNTKYDNSSQDLQDVVWGDIWGYISNSGDDALKEKFKDIAGNSKGSATSDYYIQTSADNPLILVRWETSSQESSEEMTTDVLSVTENISDDNKTTGGTIQKSGSDYVYTDSSNNKYTLTANSDGTYSYTTSDGKSSYILTRTAMNQTEIQNAIKSNYSGKDVTFVFTDGADQFTYTVDGYTYTVKQSDFYKNSVTVDTAQSTTDVGKATGSSFDDLKTKLKSQLQTYFSDSNHESDTVYIGSCSTGVTKNTYENFINNTLAEADVSKYVDYSDLTTTEIVDLLTQMKTNANEQDPSDDHSVGESGYTDTVYKDGKFTHFEVIAGQQVKDTDGNVVDAAILDGTVNLTVSNNATTLVENKGKKVTLNTTAQLGNEGYEFTHKGKNYEDSTQRDFYKLTGTIAYDLEGTYTTQEAAETAKNALEDSSTANVVRSTLVDNNGNQTVVYKVYRKTGSLLAYGYMTDADNVCQGSPHTFENGKKARGYDLYLQNLTLVNDKIVAQGTTQYYSADMLVRANASTTVYAATSKTSATGVKSGSPINEPEAGTKHHAIYGDWTLVKSTSSSSTSKVEGTASTNEHEVYTYREGGAVATGTATTSHYSGTVTYKYTSDGGYDTYTVSNAQKTTTRTRTFKAKASITHDEEKALYRTVTKTTTIEYGTPATPDGGDIDETNGGDSDWEVIIPAAAAVTGAVIAAQPAAPVVELAAPVVEAAAPAAEAAAPAAQAVAAKLPQTGAPVMQALLLAASGLALGVASLFTTGKHEKR